MPYSRKKILVNLIYSKNINLQWGKQNSGVTSNSRFLFNNSGLQSSHSGGYSRAKSLFSFVLILIGTRAYSLSRADQLLLNKLLLKDDAKVRRAYAQPSKNSKKKN